MLLLSKTAQYMQLHQMAETGSRLVIGLSGGMDSVCLFHILQELGYELVAVHVHHGIRGEEADRDERFCRSLCRQYKVPFYGYHFDVPQISRREHLSEEEAGRNVRRQAFLEVMEKTGAQRIALAHHADDRAETLLFHLIRGTGLRGMGSMKPRSGAVIRPLLWAQRKEIEEYVNTHHYEYVEDATNASAEYTRNRLRHQVMPVLKEINAAAAVHLCDAAEKLGGVSDYIDAQAQELKKSCAVCKDGEARIRGDIFLNAPEVLKVPLLQSCIAEVSGSLADIGQEHFAHICALFAMQNGKTLCLPAGLTAEKTYEGVRLYRRREQKKEAPVEIKGSGSYRFGERIFQVSIEEWDETKNFPRKTYTKCFDYDKMKGNIFLRTREAGDYLQISRTGGTKRLQDYLVNEKVPREERDSLPLFADGSHIFWVVGKRISEYYKVTEKTKRVLKVQTDGGKEDGFYSKGTDPAGETGGEDQRACNSDQ